MNDVPQEDLPEEDPAGSVPRPWTRVFLLLVAFGLFAIGMTIILRNGGGIETIVGLISALLAAVQLLLMPTPRIGRPLQRMPSAVTRPLPIIKRLRGSMPYVALLASALLFTYTIGPWGKESNPCEVAQIAAMNAYLSTVSEECIGISNGNAFFDGDFPFATREYGVQREKILDLLEQGRLAEALEAWKATGVTNDAEMLIYLENHRAVQTRLPIVNFVVTTMITGEYAQIGRDELQGAYVAQREANDKCILDGCAQVRLFVANSGSGMDTSQRVINTARIAEQIVKNRNSLDIKGVMGWPFSGQTSVGIQALGPANIPTVAPTASSDALSNTPYFWRAGPADSMQAKAAVPYATETLKSKRPAVFYDAIDPYSASLGKAFIEEFTARTGRAPITQLFVAGKVGVSEYRARIDALRRATPDLDLVYFAGYGGDASLLMQALPGPETGHIEFMGGDGLFNVETYVDGQIPRNVFGRLHFTVFGHSDTWRFLRLPEPSFYCLYSASFEPGRVCREGADDRRSHFSLPNADNILSYDAMKILLAGSKAAMVRASGKSTFSTQELQEGIELVAKTGFQGVSGWIALGTDGNPKNKAVVLLATDERGNIGLKDVRGCVTQELCR